MAKAFAFEGESPFLFLNDALGLTKKAGAFRGEYFPLRLLTNLAYRNDEFSTVTSVPFLILKKKSSTPSSRTAKTGA